MRELNYFKALILSILLLSVFGCASTDKQSGTGEFFDDTVITTKVKTAIFNEPTLKSTEISVKTFKGVVQLSGFVGTDTEITMATTVASKVKGVKSVSNSLLLK